MKITETTIELRDLLFRAGHGVEDREKVAGNSYLVSLQVWPSDCRGMVTDSVSDTISYANLYTLVRRVMTEGEPSDLLEHVAYLILTEIELSGLQIDRARVTITKVQPPIQGFLGEGASFTATASYR